MKYYAIKFFLIIYLYISIVACSDKGSEADPCPITVDSVSIIDSVKTGSITYYLVYRISGWSDKTEILELYNIKPVFDHCSRSNVEPLYGDSLEMEETVSHVYLDANNKLLEIVYVKGEPDKLHNKNLKLELR